MAQGRVKIGVSFDVDKSGLNELKSQLQGLQNLAVKDLVSVNTKDAESQLERIKVTAQQVEAALEKSFNPKLNTTNLSVFNKELQKQGLSLSQIKQEWSQAGVAGQQALNNLTGRLLTTNRHLRESSQLLDKMAETMSNTIRWSIASTAINTMTGSIQKAYSFTKQLDETLNDIRIVTGKSSDEMARFAKQANNAAKNLGAVTTDYTKAALIYYQQGLSDTEVAARANTTIKAANVTGQSASTVSEQLTAVWNGYKVSAAEAELYVDKLSAVAATTAADLEELSTGMSKVASAANIMGVDIDQLNAQLATIVSVTREAPESIGTALKTVYARMSDIEAGLDTETTLGEYTAQMKALGFNALDATGKLRDQGDVIEEIGNNWNKLSRNQQVSLAQVIAGTRQYSRMMALFDNWDMYQQAKNTSEGSAGALQKQNEIYLDSLEAHLNKLTAEAEELYSTLFDADSLNPWINAFTGVIGLTENFIESIGGGGNLLLALGGIGTTVFGEKISGGIAKAMRNVRTFVSDIDSVKVEAQMIQELSKANPELEDDALKRIVAMKQEQLKVERFLTEEQQKQAQDAINEKIALENQQAALSDKIKKAKELSAIYEADNSDDLLGIRGDIDDSMRSMSSAAKKVAKLRDLAIQEETLTRAANNWEKVYKRAETDLGKADTDKKHAGAAIRASKAQQAEADKRLAAQALAEERQDLVSDFRTTFSTTVSDIEKLTQILSKSQNEIFSSDEIARLKEIKKLMVDIDKNPAFLESADGAEQFAQAFEDISKFAEKADLTLEDTIKTLDTETEEADKLTKALKNLEDANDNFVKQFDAERVINGFLDIGSAAMNASSAISSIINLGDIWSNDDLTAGEKFLQTLTSIGFALPMLMNSIKQTKEGFGALKAMMEAYNARAAAAEAVDAAANAANAASEKAAAKAERERAEAIKAKTGATVTEAGATTGDTAANLANQASEGKKGNTLTDFFKNFKNNNKGKVSGKLKSVLTSKNAVGAVIGSAVIAMVGTGVILAAANEKQAKALEEATEAANKANDTLAQTQAQWESLNTSFDNLDSLDESLEKLTEGTVEWNYALFQANQEVLGLLNKYPELINYIDTINGKMTIDSEGREALLQKQLQQTQNASTNAILANQKQREANLDYLKDEWANTSLYGEGPGEFFANAAIIAGAGASGAGIGAAAGGGIASIPAAIIGGLAGIILGAFSVAGQEAIEEAEKQKVDESAEFKAIAEAYAEKGGRAIFESEEALRTALEKTDGELNRVEKALLQNKEATIDLIEAYNKDKSVKYGERFNLGTAALGADASDVAKILAGSWIQDNTDQYIKEVEKARSGGNDADKSAAAAAAEALGISYQKITASGSNKVQFVQADGSKLEYTMDEIYAALASEKAIKAVADQEREFERQAKQLGKAFGTDAVKDLLATTTKGKVDFSKLTMSQWADAQEGKLTASDFSALAETYGGTSAEELYKNWTEGIEAFDETMSEVIADFPQNVQDAFTAVSSSIDLSSLSYDQYAQFAQMYKQLYIAGGENTGNLFNSILEAAGNKSDDLLQQFLGVDWSSIDNINAYINSILEGINLNLPPALEDGLSHIATILAAPIRDLETLQQEYASTQDIVQDVMDDGRISADMYEKLSAEGQSYFTLMADGTAKLKTSAIEFVRYVQEHTQQKFVGDLTGLFGSLETASSNLQTYQTDVRTINERKNRIENLKKERDELASWIDIASSPAIAKLKESGLLSGQLLTTFDDADGTQYEKLQAVLDSISSDSPAAPMIAAALQYIEASGSAMGVDVKNARTKIDELNKDIAYRESLNDELRDKLPEGQTYDSAIASTKEEIEKIQDDLAERVQQAFEASGGGIQFAQLIESAKLQFKDNPAALEWLENLLSDNPQYLKDISATLKTQKIDALTDDTYKLWGNFGGDLEMLGDLEAYDRSIARYDDTLSNLQDTYKDLQGEAKFDNLASQFETATDKAEKLENQLVVLKRAALEPLRAEFDTLKAEDFAGNEVAQDLLEQVNKELISGKITQESRDKLQNLLLSGNVNSTQMAWLQNVINLYDSALTKFDEHSDKLTEANRQAREVLISTFEESTAQLNDYYDTQIGYLETSISLLDHQVELNKLINGEDSVSKDRLEDIAEARKSIYEQRKAELADWSQSYSELAADDISAEANEVRNQYYQAAQDAAQAEIEMIQAYTDANTAAVTQSIENILGTSLSALARLKEEADWTATMGNRYLSERDKAFGLDTLKYTYGQAARETVDLKVREEINALLDQELEALEAKDALTQADLDRANQQLEILKARIALERAEQDMSNMRLVRGANGEYSYQFVANPAARAEAEQRYREEVEEGRRMNEEALSASANNTYEAITSLTDYLKEVTEGGINEQEGRRIEALVGEISRAASRIKGDLDAVGADLGIDTTQKNWWLDEANQALLRTEGFTPEWIDALMKGEYDKLDADTLTKMSEGQLNDLFSKILGDEWQKVIDAANEDAKNAAENMVKPDYLKGQIDRVVASLDALAQGEEIPEWVWNSENDAGSSAPKAPAANGLKPVISRLDGTQIENIIRSGVATTISTFEGANNRVHLTPVDAGNGIIEQKVEIVANFPDATDRDEIKAAFDDLIGLAVQHANQNVKGK